MFTLQIIFQLVLIPEWLGNLQHGLNKFIQMDLGVSILENFNNNRKLIEVKHKETNQIWKKIS